MSTGWSDRGHRRALIVGAFVLAGLLATSLALLRMAGPDRGDSRNAASDNEAPTTEVRDLSTAPATPDLTTTPRLEPCSPAEYPPDSAGRAVCDENTRGKFEGVIAGLRIAPDSAAFGEHTVPCKEPARRIASPDTVAGSSMDIFVRELPRGWSDTVGTGFTAWACDDRVITSDRLLLVTPGVTVHIVKYLRPEAWVAISASAERIAETSIGAQQLVVVAGIPGLESVDARVAFAVKTVDGFVVTEVIGNNASPDQLLAVASALLRFCSAPASASTTFTVITTSRPWWARWVDQWDNETGFLLELRYLGATPDRSGGETFEYHLPPNTTEHAIPEADMPGAAGTGACLARNDAEFRLYVELPAGRLEASSASLLGLCR